MKVHGNDEQTQIGIEWEQSQSETELGNWLVENERNSRLKKGLERMDDMEETSRGSAMRNKLGWQIQGEIQRSKT